MEVYKLYPNAELPSIRVGNVDDDSFRLIYSSSRAFGLLALGLIEATFELYQEEEFTIETESASERGGEVTFLRKRI
jgi:MoaA/NifB/PqqE/SkfB family radical SAM enzyme